jgi:hypothetical protein
MLTSIDDITWVAYHILFTILSCFQKKAAGRLVLRGPTALGKRILPEANAERWKL